MSRSRCSGLSSDDWHRSRRRSRVGERRPPTGHLRHRARRTVRTLCAGGLRALDRRCRRHRVSRARPCGSRRLSRHPPHVDRYDERRRVLLSRPCPPRRRSHRLRIMPDGRDRSRRIGPLGGRPAAMAPHARRHRRAIRRAVRHRRAALYLHAARSGLYEALRRVARAARLRGGRTTEMGAPQPQGATQGADLRRGRARVAIGRVPVPRPRMLPRDRRRRSARRGGG